MSEPLDSSTIQLLDLVELNIERYFSKYNENTHIFDGRNTNKIFKPGQQKVTDDGINIKSEHWMTDTVRPSSSPLSDNRTLGRFQPRQFKVRYDVDTPASNDFTSFDAATRISHLELHKLTDAAGIVKVAERLVRQVQRDYDTKKAVACHTPKSSAIATVMGNMIDSENLLEYTGTTYSTGTTVRFKIDGGAIAALRNGTVLVITKSDGTLPVTCQINHVNVVDNSIRVTVTSDSANADFTGTSTYDNGLIYFSNVSTSDNPGMYSVYEWFNKPTASESWMGGKDRTSVTDSYLNPLRLEAAASGSTTPIQQQHLDDLAEAMQSQMDEDWSAVIFGHNKLINSLRRQVGESALTTEGPSSPDGYNFGSKTIGYQHANLGRVQLMGEPISHPNRLYFMVPQTWQRFHYGRNTALNVLPGDTTNLWSRMQSATANSGKGKYYQAEWFQEGLADVCLSPEMNGVILNVEP